VEPHLGRWVEYTRPAHDLVRAARVPEPEVLPATIKAHIQFQLDNLMTYDLVAKGVAEGRVTIHGWLYDMEKGEIQAYDPKSGGWRGLLELAEEAPG
jgi:carbonic anhydrase